MKRYLTLLSFFPLLWSCTEEVSKDINTDLTVEATHFFNFSEAMLESTYLGNISYPEYARIISGNLPGCPEVTLLTPESSPLIMMQSPSASKKITRQERGELSSTFLYQIQTLPAGR
jgi:hypothetical protein